MHIAEGIIPVKQALVTSLLAVPIVFSSALALKQMMATNHDQPGARPFLTMAFALCFAVTLLPMPVPVVGASSHMCATPLLALILGPAVIPVVTAALLLVQALFFAHGGLTTLGANTLTLGVIGPAVTLGIFRGLTALRVAEKHRLVVSCLLGSLAVYAGDSFLLAWSFADKQPFATTFYAVSLGFLPAQGPLSLLEAFISAGVVSYLAKQRREFMPLVIWGRRPVASSITSTLTGNAIILALWLGKPSRAQASFEGLDDALFIKTAESLGGQAKDLTPWITGEVELAVFSLGFLIAGFIAGRAFAAWRTECRAGLAVRTKANAS